MIKIDTNTNAKITMDKYLPKIICAFVIGDEYKSFIVPPARSLLTNPIVSTGMYKKR